MKKLITLCLLLACATPVFAQYEAEIPEGKVLAAEASLLENLVKEVDGKQQKAYSFAAIIGEIANSAESRHDDAEYARVGFVARLQSIREEREDQKKKGVKPDFKTTEAYSKRLDNLIEDMKTFLK
jgi:hypothetical protein